MSKYTLTLSIGEVLETTATLRIEKIRLEKLLNQYREDKAAPLLINPVISQLKNINSTIEKLRAIKL